MPHVEPERDTRPTLAVVDVTEGLKLILSGDAEQSYDIQFSTDLKSWNTLVNVTTGETGTVEYIDITSREVLAKETWIEAAVFYRARSSD